MTDYDVIIIGAGAAGLMCAIEAGKRDRRVLVIESTEQIAGKIRISGGGRCNFTNLEMGTEKFISQNPHFCKSALGRYGPKDFISIVEQYNITYHEKAKGQLFCDGKSSQIIDMLITECEKYGVTIRTSCVVEDTEKKGDIFLLHIRNETLSCASLVVASGGKSIPKMGASGFGYKLAEQFGLALIAPEPALVPFTLQNDLHDKLKSLAGISVDAVVKWGKISFRDAILFTHRGLSGPAILQISSYWRAGDVVSINLSPNCDIRALLKEQRTVQPKQEIHNLLTLRFARRLAQYICDEVGIMGKMADLSNEKIDKIADFIHDFRIKPNGTEGYRTAEVTRGGVDTDEISSKTFEAKKVKGLYFIGEVLDVTGQLGGYNFQWAWASGHAAGQYV
ncbi:MAG: NAD(P)/FAD-dependent oxidoreductase [Emcibacter sp.]|nr:NAD(P)/FAD-dependent oxidoreductase [Emcibacter sp.]